MSSDRYPVHGAGLGLRRSFPSAVAGQPPDAVEFWEIAPENWIGVGGIHGKRLRAMTERLPFVCHGLSLSIGSPAPLDTEHVQAIRAFMATHLLVYRTRDDKIAFIETNAVTQRLLALMKEHPTESGQELLRRIAAELRHPAPDSVVAFGARLLDDLRARGVLLGTRRPAS